MRSLRIGDKEMATGILGQVVLVMMVELMAGMKPRKQSW